MRQNKGVWIPKQRANKKNGKKQNSNSRTAGRTESKHKNGTEKAKNAKRKKKAWKQYDLRTIWRPPAAKGQTERKTTKKNLKHHEATRAKTHT